MLGVYRHFAAKHNLFGDQIRYAAEQVRKRGPTLESAAAYAYGVLANIADGYSGP